MIKHCSIDLLYFRLDLYLDIMSNLGLYRKIDLIYNLDSILAIDLFSGFPSKGDWVFCRRSFSNVE